MAQIRWATVVLLFVSRVAFAQDGPAPRPEPIVDTPEFMTFLMKPAYVDLQHAVEQTPPDRAAWSGLYVKAVRLAETANLLFIRHHAGADTPAWAERSAGVRQAAANVAAAVERGLRNARPEDFATVQQRYREVAGACNACHRQFGGTNAPAIRD